MKQDFELIANGNIKDLIAWAEEQEDFPHTILELLKKGYIPRWRPAAEYRGALVFTLKAIAKKALKGL